MNERDPVAVVARLERRVMWTELVQMWDLHFHYLFLFLLPFPGFLINFVSAPVMSAFTSAVSIQVATSQIKGLLGLKVLLPIS